MLNDKIIVKKLTEIRLMQTQSERLLAKEIGKLLVTGLVEINSFVYNINWSLELHDKLETKVTQLIAMIELSKDGKVVNMGVQQ
jgi:hypothetical protein